MAATVWKGYLSFGLVSFPIRLFAAARTETVHFHMLHKTDLSRVHEVFFCVAEDKQLTREDIVKGYEYEKNEYVVVEPEELEKVAPPTARTMEILQFTPARDVDPIYLDKSYYVAPEEEVSKPYALLLKAMSESGYHAIAKMAMHGREHIVILRPTTNGFVLHTAYFADELHEANKVKVDEGSFNPKELELAKKLIDSLAGPFDPGQFHDEYRENVLKLIEQKRKGQKVTAPKEAKRPSPVINIMEALQRSLEATKAASKQGFGGKSVVAEKAEGKKSTTKRKTARKSSAA